MKYSAPISVSHYTGENLESTMRSEFALNAALSSQLTNIAKQSAALEAVQCIEECQKSDRVYDMTVNGEHEFFAGGILVHNCIDSIRYGIGPLIKNGKGFGAFRPSGRR